MRRFGPVRVAAGRAARRLACATPVAVRRPQHHQRGARCGGTQVAQARREFRRVGGRVGAVAEALVGAERQHDQRRRQMRQILVQRSPDPTDPADRHWRRWCRDWRRSPPVGRASTLQASRSTGPSPRARSVSVWLPGAAGTVSHTACTDAAAVDAIGAPDWHRSCRRPAGAAPRSPPAPDLQDLGRQRHLRLPTACCRRPVMPNGPGSPRKLLTTAQPCGVQTPAPAGSSDTARRAAARRARRRRIAPGTVRADRPLKLSFAVWLSPICRITTGVVRCPDCAASSARYSGSERRGITQPARRSRRRMVPAAAPARRKPAEARPRRPIKCDGTMTA